MSISKYRANADDHHDDDEDDEDDDDDEEEEKKEEKTNDNDTYNPFDLPANMELFHPQMCIKT